MVEVAGAVANSFAVQPKVTGFDFVYMASFEYCI